MTGRKLSFMKFALDSSPDPAFWIGPDARFICANDALYSLLGYSADEWRSMSIPDVDLTLSQQSWPRAWQRIQQGMAPFESSYQAKNGRIVPVEIRPRYVQDPGGGYACVVLRDITERKQMLGEIERQRIDLARADQRLLALNTVTAILGESLDLDNLLSEVIKKITEVFHFNATRIYLYNSTRDEILLKASFETHSSVWANVKSFRKGQGNVGKAAEFGEPIVYEDIQTDPVYRVSTHTKNSLNGGVRFFAAFPIKGRLRNAGTIVCASFESVRLSPDDRQLIASMANHIGIATENIALFEERKAKADELSALYSVATTINQSLNLNVVLRNVMHRVLEIFRANAARIYLLDESGREARLLAQEGFPRGVHVPESYRSGEGITGRILETGQPLFFEDIMGDPAFGRLSRKELALKDLYRSQFFIPIGVKKRTVGVMSFFSRERRHFSASDVRLIRAIADHVGIAFDNASLFGRSVRESQRLGALVKINRDIASLLDRDILLPRIAEEARRVLNVTAVSIRLLHEDDHTVCVAIAGKEGLAGLWQRLPLDGTLTGRIVRENRAICSATITTDPRLSEEYRPRMTEAGRRSFLGVPLRIGNRMLGTVNCASDTARDFIEEEISLMRAFADQAAIAIENADLFATISNKVVEMEEANRELEEASRVRSNFMNAMSHELRTPLSAIMGYTALLKDGYGGTSNPAQQEALDSIYHQSHLLLRLINNVLTLARLDARGVSLELSRTPLQETMGHVRAYVKHLNQKEQLEFLWHVDEDLPVMVTDHVKLEEILQNLISNAYKFSTRGSIEIRVRDIPLEKRVEFTVADTGIGIQPAELEKVFDRFYCNTNTHMGDLRGMGLGLSIVREYLDVMKGKIRLHSEPGKGTTFTFDLPYSLSVS